ncbi:MAG: esterase [Acidobacteria bacterium]|nr:esterase [Acidobacteriota bacterium]
MRTLLLSTLCVAAAAAQPLLMSPEVSADRTVTFRLEAPEAKQVLVVSDWGLKDPMQKGADGVWTFTTKPLAPSTYIYSYEVDGVPTVDPINPMVKLRARGSASLVTVPGNPPALWDLRAVPHGGVTAEWQKSKLLSHDPIVTVYTPPGYRDNPKKAYPVLYLLHGNNDTPVGWTMVGKANLIADNLLAEGKMEPMIIVMPFGHAVPYSSSREERAGNTALFEKYLLGEVIPMIESRYRVKKDRKSRALAGLSMGGAQSTTIGLAHLDRFSSVAAFSGVAVADDLAAKLPQVFDDSKKTNGLLETFWIGCGLQDEGALGRTKAFAALLEQKGIEHELQLQDGVHNYQQWQRNLADLLPLLFR